MNWIFTLSSLRGLPVIEVQPTLWTSELRFLNSDDVIDFGDAILVIEGLVSDKRLSKLVVW